jgi:hypothetical protein
MAKSSIHAQQLSSLIQSNILSPDNVITSKILDVFDNVLVTNYNQSITSKGSGRVSFSILIPAMEIDIAGMTVKISSTGGAPLPNSIPKLDFSLSYNIPMLDLIGDLKADSIGTDPVGFIKNVH